MAESQWNKLDMLSLFATSKIENTLIDIRKGAALTSTSPINTVTGGVQFTGVSGSSFTGPSTDNFKFTKDNIEASMFVYDGSTLQNGHSLYTIENTGVDAQPDSTRYRWRAQTGGFRNGNGAVFSNELLVNLRDDTGTSRFLVNTAQIDSQVNTPIELNPAVSFQIGTRSSNFGIFVCSLFSTGRGTGVNQVAKNDIYRQWLTDLGVGLP